jgi:hypothetical protein
MTTIHEALALFVLKFSVYRNIYFHGTPYCSSLCFMNCTKITKPQKEKKAGETLVI